MSNRQPDVIVIGAGVVGLFTAWELADAGLQVTVIERGEIGREASWAGGGILSPLHPWRYPEAVLSLANWSQIVYPSIARRLMEFTGIDPEWTTSGMLIQESDSVSLANDWARQHPIDLQVLAACEQRRRFPDLEPVENAILLPAVAQIRNPRLLKSLTALLRQKSMQIRTYTPVEQILIEQGKVCGVKTPEGRIVAGRVVVTAGAWSGGIAPLQLPIKPIKGQMLLYAAPKVPLPVMVLRDDTYLIQRQDGRILVGSSVEDSGFDKSVSETVRRRLHEQAKAIFPALDANGLERHWAGLRPGSPDGVPFICSYPGIEGLYVNSGHFRHGLLTAPASARLLVDQMLQRPPIMNTTSFRLG